VPGSTAVTTPASLTVATNSFELDHVTVPPEGHVVAVSVSVSPSTMEVVALLSLTP